VTTPKSEFVKLIANLLGIMFFCVIIACLYALGTFLYSSPTVNPVSPAVDALPDKFSKSIAQRVGSEHFHLLDKIVYTDIYNAPLCLRCHGNFCHAKSEKLRSFYNMHTFFLACETCHLRPVEDERYAFQWFDDKTGGRREAIRGTDGNYGAKIVPVKESARLDVFPKEALALEYMKMKDTYSEEEKKKKQEELMAQVTKEPITCEECHQQKGYLDYASLGYDPPRAAQLASNEIVKVSKEYGDFHLPTMFDPSVAGRKPHGQEPPAPSTTSPSSQGQKSE
jgi:hypothetical protein